MKLIRGEELHIARWSGGTTTQLGIFPADGDYSKREFKWRISSAVVEDEYSSFTSLPGVSRILMVLEGELALIHEGHHSCELKQYDQDSFMGDWSTRSEGKVKDFNLMIKGDGKGSLEALTLDSNSSKVIGHMSTDYENLHCMIYIAKGSVTIDNIKANAGDVVLFESEIRDLSVANTAREQSDIVIARIGF